MGFGWSLPGGVNISYSSTATANYLVQWDANVTLQASSYNIGYQTFAGAGGTTTLTASSPQFNDVTSGGAQNVDLPNATTVKVGAQFEVWKRQNNSAITVRDAGGNTVINLSSSVCFVRIICTNNSTANGVWNVVYVGTSESVASSFVMRTSGGQSQFTTCNATTYTTTSASGSTSGSYRLATGDTIGWRNGANNGNLTLAKDASDVFTLQGNALIQNNHINSYTTTATAAGTTTLTNASTHQQWFTGSTTQTVTLPVASTMYALGQTFKIANLSSGALTVNSSGGNLVATVNGSTSVTITCILLSGTSAASWAII